MLSAIRDLDIHYISWLKLYIPLKHSIMCYSVINYCLKLAQWDLQCNICIWQLSNGVALTGITKPLFLTDSNSLSSCWGKSKVIYSLDNFWVSVENDIMAWERVKKRDKEGDVSQPSQVVGQQLRGWATSHGEAQEPSLSHPALWRHDWRGSSTLHPQELNHWLVAVKKYKAEWTCAQPRKDCRGWLSTEGTHPAVLVFVQGSVVGLWHCRRWRKTPTIDLAHQPREPVTSDCEKRKV